jgi:hypothetical protein
VDWAGLIAPSSFAISGRATYDAIEGLQVHFAAKLRQAAIFVITISTPKTTKYDQLIRSSTQSRPNKTAIWSEHAQSQETDSLQTLAHTSNAWSALPGSIRTAITRSPTEYSADRNG